MLTCLMGHVCIKRGQCPSWQKKAERARRCLTLSSGLHTYVAIIPFIQQLVTMMMSNIATTWLPSLVVLLVVGSLGLVLKETRGVNGAVGEDDARTCPAQAQQAFQQTPDRPHTHTHTHTRIHSTHSTTRDHTHTHTHVSASCVLCVVSCVCRRWRTSRS